MKMETAQILVRYRLHCIWEGQYPPTAEVERVAGWIFPTGSLPKNPDPAQFTESEIEILRRMSDKMVEGVTEPES